MKSMEDQRLCIAVTSTSPLRLRSELEISDIDSKSSWSRIEVVSQLPSLRACLTITAISPRLTPTEIRLLAPVVTDTEVICNRST